MQRQHNWADNYTFKAARLLRPETIDEARRMVAQAERIRAVGTRHSFNGIADSAGDMLDLSALPFDPTLDQATGEVTIASRTRYGDLAGWLESKGRALHNMGSLPHISVAGAVSTGTHGSGDRNGILGTAVCGLELITETGDLVTVRRGDPGFDGMVVGLGAFGIVTRLTLETQPSYLVRQDAYLGLPWPQILENLDTVMGTAYSVSVMTLWSTENAGRLWLKTRIGQGHDDGYGQTYLGAASSITPALPPPARNLIDRMTEFGGVVGPWSKRMPHFRFDTEPSDGDEIQSEYMVPRARAMEAARFLRDMGKEIDELLRMTEIRTMAPDQLWLSPAQGQDATAFHFTWKREPEPVAAITKTIETKLVSLGGRPHWGKLIHSDAATLAPLYPRMADYRALVRDWSPKGKFLNDYLARHVLG